MDLKQFIDNFINDLQVKQQHFKQQHLKQQQQEKT